MVARIRAGADHDAGATLEAAEGTKVRSDQDGAVRRRATQFVTAALKRAAPLLEEEGVTGRMFSGLWTASISALLMTLDPGEVIDRLVRCSVRLASNGNFVQVDLVDVPEGEAAAVRREEISRAARIFSAALETALDDAEAAGIDEHFPDSVLDRMVEVLDREWGAWHLRRALAEQVVMLESGEGAVVDVREPRRAPEQPRTLPALAGRPVRLRAVMVRVEADTSNGKPRWAYVVHTTAADGSGFSETREAVCPAPGANAARAVLAGIVAALEAVRADGEGAHVMVETTHAQLLSGVASPAGRSASDMATWRRLDDLCEGVDLDWRRYLPASGRADEMGARCARLLACELQPRS